MYVNDLQAKVVVLYTMKKATVAMSEAELRQIIVDTEILDYFSFMHYFYDLKEYGYFKETVIDGEVRYDIESKGVEAVELFEDKIPPAIKRKLNIEVERLLDSYEKPTDVRVSTTAISETRFVAKCGIYEWNVPLLEVNLTVGDKRSAEQIAKNFEQNATKIYKKIFKAMND